MISDDTLILYSFGDELDEAEQRRIAAALAGDAALAARYDALISALPQPDTLPRLDMADGFEQQLHDLVRAAASSPAVGVMPARRRRGRWLLPVFAVAATVFLAVAINLAPDSPGVIESPPTRAATVEPSVRLERGLRAYLVSARAELASLPDQPSTARTTATERLIIKNHGLMSTADALRAADRSRLLRGFDPLLRELASTDTGASRASDLREQLSFEMQVVLTKLSAAGSNSV